MPCYQPSSEYMSGYESGREVHAEHHPDDKKEIHKLTKQNDWLEAALCAILNELEERGIAAAVAADSSRNGLVDIMGFWSFHRESDESRLASKLHEYSKDEQRILKKLLEAEQ